MIIKGWRIKFVFYPREWWIGLSWSSSMIPCAVFNFLPTVGIAIHPAGPLNKKDW